MKSNLLFKIKSWYILWKLSYYKDQKGILERYLREKINWDKHLLNCKNFILQAVSKYSNPSIAILGSGWLLDVPINELLNTSKKITLIDIIHPNKIKNKYANNSKIKFINEDLTGGMVENVYNKFKWYNKVQSLPLENNNFINFNDYDFVISLNLLNQLDILLIEYIRKIQPFSTEEFKQFSISIQKNHLHALPHGKSCLITDYLEDQLNEAGNLVNRLPLVYIDFPKSTIEENWTWKFDSSKTYNNNYITHLKVKALLF